MLCKKKRIITFLLILKGKKLLDLKKKKEMSEYSLNRNRCAIMKWF